LRGLEKGGIITKKVSGFRHAKNTHSGSTEKWKKKLASTERREKDGRNHEVLFGEDTKTGGNNQRARAGGSGLRERPGKSMLPPQESENGQAERTTSGPSGGGGGRKYHD